MVSKKGKVGFASIIIVEITTSQRAAGTYLALGMSQLSKIVCNYSCTTHMP